MGHRRTRNRTWSREEVGLVLAATLAAQERLAVLGAHRREPVARVGRARQHPDGHTHGVPSSEPGSPQRPLSYDPTPSALTTAPLSVVGWKPDASTWQAGHLTDLHPVLLGLRPKGPAARAASGVSCAAD